VCKLPKPNKCENCPCLADPANPSKQICSPADGCAWGYGPVPGNPAKYVVPVCAEHGASKLDMATLLCTHTPRCSGAVQMRKMPREGLQVVQAGARTLRRVLGRV
jgi:hypothetical protein